MHFTRRHHEEGLADVVIQWLFSCFLDDNASKLPSVFAKATPRQAAMTTRWRDIVLM
jgi:hypothetical protein